MIVLILLFALAFGSVSAQELYNSKECPQMHVRKSYYQGAVLHLEIQFYKPLELNGKVYCKDHVAYVSGFVGSAETVLKGGVKEKRVGAFVRQVSLDETGQFLYVIYDVLAPMPGELVQWKVVRLTFISPSVEIKEGKWKRG